MVPLKQFTFQIARAEIDKPVQLTELVDQSMMPMVMVLRTTSIEPEKNSTDSTFQTTSSQPKISTTPTTATSQVTLERPSTKEDQTIFHHTSTQ